jgi:hypothetical protein
MNTPYDIITASLITNFSVATKETNVGGIYFSNGKMFITGTSNQSVHYYSLPIANILVNIYNESSLLLANVTNFTVTISNSTNTITKTTTTGTTTITGLTSIGEYKISYWSSTHGVRDYYYNLTSTNTTQTLNLYTISSAEDTVVLVNVLDTTATRVSNATVRVQKQNETNIDFYFVEMCRTDILGQCLLHLELYDSNYKFLIDYEGETKIDSGITRVSLPEISFIINLLGDYLQSYFENYALRGNLSYSSTTKNFTFVFYDSYGNINTGCLKVQRRIGTTLSDYGTTNCSTTTSGTLIKPIDDTLNDEFIASAYFTYTDGRQDYHFQSLSVVTNDFTKENGSTKLFLFGFILTGTIVFAGLNNPVVAVILLVTSLFTFNMLGFIGLGTTTVVTVVVLGVITIILMRKT